MGVRDAFQAGMNELTRPMASAPARQIKPTGGVMASVCNAGMKSPPGPWLTMEHIPAARTHPMAPPINAMIADSPRTIPRMAPGVNPRVFRMPTSRMRSRTDMEIVLAETSRIVNITAPQMAMINRRRFPRNDMKLSWNAFSDSLRVGNGDIANMSSMVEE